MADVLRLDASGALLSGDAAIVALNARAGGAIGSPLALPALAAVARLARTLSVSVARSVVVADGARDLRLHVEAGCDAAGCTLVLSEQAVVAPRASWLVSQPTAAADVRNATGWTWAVDAELRLIALDAQVEAAAGPMARQPLTRLVRLIEDESGDLPILSALATGGGFAGQRAVRRDLPEVEFVLRAQRRVDAAGVFAGFAGDAQVLTSIERLAHDPRFAERLGGALRGPLDRIVARADSIGAQTGGPLRRDYADYAGDIASAGRHLLALVEDLADLESVDRPDFSVEVDAIDLADLARRAAGLLSVRAADAGVRIDRPDADETLPARGDFRRVLQIVVNLIGNAVRYSPRGAMVWLRTEAEDGSAVLIVADQGKGIAATDHARIFEKFERVDPTEPGGSGLGLYISRRLARAMGGDITVDSAPGQGARFVLTLPAA